MQQTSQVVAAHLAHELAFPHDNDMPTQIAQLQPFFVVAIPVALNLLMPEINITLGQNKIWTPLMTMPEAAVHKDDSAQTRDYNVRSTGQ